MISVFEGYRHLLGPTHKHTLISLQNLAEVYKKNDEHDYAAKIYNELLQVWESGTAEANRAQMCLVKGRLAFSLSILGKNQEALDLVQK